MTSPLPPRRYLPEDVELALIEGIREGRFRDFLPGERRLALLLGVSRPTLRVALNMLINQGRILVEQGRRTRIVHGVEAKVTPAATGRVILLTADELHLLSPADLLIIDLLRARLESVDLRLEHRACHAFQHVNPERGLERLLCADSADAWLLLQAPPRVQSWFHARRLPAIVLGTPASGVDLPGVDTDYRPAVRHAFGQLTKAGHSPDTIALVLPDIDLAGHRAMLDGFAEAGGASGSVLRHPVDFSAIGAWVDRRFVLMSRRPGAVIVAWPKMTLALLTRLGLGHGWKIPERLSALCLSHDPAFEMVQPVVGHYRRNPERYAGVLAKLILRTTKCLVEPDESRSLMPVYVKGGTVAPPVS